MSHDLSKCRPNTKAVHAGQEVDPSTGAVSVPIYQSSTFAFENCEQGANRFAGKEDGYIYTRMGNPTIARLQEAVATLEGGYGAFATGSGMAALCTILFGLASGGDHIVGTNAVYGPSRLVIEQHFSRFGLESTFVDTSDLDAVKAAMRPNTKIVFIETPANPTMLLTDIKEVAKIAHENDALLLVDNTFASPILQRPFEYGADVVMHSLTKFINGHTDIVGGMVVPKTEELWKQIKPSAWYLGACMDPHQAWLVHRGMRSLAMRVDYAQKNAISIADFLENHPKVESILYPGLKSHPQYELAQSQMDGPGSLISFEIKGGVKAGARLLDNLHLMTLAVSLGGIETLIQHPAGMTHAGMPREERIKAGITDGLVRLAVGCEDVQDLIDDLDQAFVNV